MTTRKERIAEFDQGYNITVSGRNVHITEGMKQHAIDKLSKLERFGNRIVDIAVTMDIQKLDNRVDIVIKYGHTIIKSHGSSTDMYVSIDMAVDKLQAQLVKYKSKLDDHHAKGHPVVDVPMKIYGVNIDYEVPVDEVFEVNSEIESETKQRQVDRFKPHRIVKVETRPLKILTDEEAIMKMELSQDPLMIFRSEMDRRLKVIWRLEDGNFGIVEPE